MSGAGVEAADVAAEVWAALAQARADGTAAHDAVGWAVIEGLARRAAAQQGAVREALLRRVAQRLEALQPAPAPLTSNASGGAATAAPASQPGTERDAPIAVLSALVDRLGRAPAPPATSRALPAGTSARAPQPLKSVAAFKGTWARLRADQRLRQAMSQVPSMAGPLNSSHLVSRMLQTLRELSPEYLDAFMAHADTLLWLEQASGAVLPVRAPRR